MNNCTVCGKEIAKNSDVCKECWSKPGVALMLNMATAAGHLSDAIKYDDYRLLEQHYDLLAWCERFEARIKDGTVYKYWVDSTRCWNVW